MNNWRQLFPGQRPFGSLAQNVPAAFGFVVNEIVAAGPECKLLAVQVGVKYSGGSLIGVPDEQVIQRSISWLEIDYQVLFPAVGYPVTWKALSILGRSACSGS